MCCSCRLGKVRSIISFPTHLKGENQMRVYSSFGVLLQAVIQLYTMDLKKIYRII